MRRVIENTNLTQVHSKLERVERRIKWKVRFEVASDQKKKKKS